MCHRLVYAKMGAGNRIISPMLMVMRVDADDVFLVILKVLAVVFDVSNFVVSLDIVDGNTINQ